jgi:polyphenol oxidase
MEPFGLKAKEFFTISSWENEHPDLVVGFTTKNGGYSLPPFHTFNLGFHVGDTIEAVCENKNLLSNILDFPLKSWVAAEQTHGTNIKHVVKSDCGSGSNSYEDAIPDTDGLFTSESGILLTLCFADCVPLYFLDRNSKRIGIAHAGWKGTVKGIAKEMVLSWQQLGIDLKNILVTIGPSICEKCYIVNDYVIEFVHKILEDVEKKPYNLLSEGQYQLDLRLLNKILLIQAGIPETNISVSKLCSSCQEDSFYSYRRDSGTTGRMMSFIGWKGE